MKDFILDSTYKEVTIIDSNNDIINMPLTSVPNNNMVHHSINLNKNNLTPNSNHIKNNKFNPYNLIDYL